MRLIKCRVCKHECAPDAKVCPNCGAPNPKTKHYGCGSLLLVLVVGFFAFSYLLSPRSSFVPPSANSRPAPAAPAAPPTPASKWLYSSSVDEMSGARSVFAAIQSENTFEFTFPYTKPQRATLTLRKHPRHGQDVIIAVERGQFLCGGPCDFLVRFDDGRASAFTMNKPESNDSTMLFLQNASRFLSSMRSAKTVRIEGKFFQQQPVVLEFDVSGFDEEKFK